MKQNPERLYHQGRREEHGTTRLFHAICFEVDGQMLTFGEYQQYLVFGKVPVGD